MYREQIKCHLICNWKYPFWKQLKLLLQGLEVEGSIIQQDKANHSYLYLDWKNLLCRGGGGGGGREEGGRQGEQILVICAGTGKIYYAEW